MTDKLENLQANTGEFLNGYTQEKRRAAIYNILLMALLVAFAGALGWGAHFLYEIGVYAEIRESGAPWALLPWLVTAAVLSVPVIWALRVLDARRHEALTLAYGFQRKAIVEERVFAYGGIDSDFRKQLLRDYVGHWMAKSPLEVMLALRSKGGGSFQSPPQSAIDRVADTPGKG